MSALRLCALALLGCGSSLALLPPRVAFQQHGVIDGGDPIMMAPSRSQGHGLTPQLLASAVARVMSLDARAEVGADLPAGDMFNRPDGNLLVFVDGLQPFGSGFTPVMTGWLRESPAAYSVSVPTREVAASSVLHTVLGRDFDVMDVPGANNDFVCASINSELHLSDACASARGVSGLGVRAWAGAGAGAWMEGGADRVKALLGPGASVKGMGEEKGWTIRLPYAGWETDYWGDDVVLELDSDVQADSLLMEELQLLADLPEALSSTLDSFSSSSSLVEEELSPSLAILYLSSLDAVAKEYGEGSEKGRAAFHVLDSSLARSVEVMATGRRLTSQLVAGLSLGGALNEAGVRRLDSLDSSSNSTSGNSTYYSLEEISQFQLNMWTGVFLFILAFLAVYGVVTMDIQPDSLLYAKFAADTSGGLKVD